MYHWQGVENGTATKCCAPQLPRQFGGGGRSYLFLLVAWAFSLREKRHEVSAVWS